jgi:hypothetical protein
MESPPAQPDINNIPKENLLSRVRVAIFWDYENIPLPKENPEHLISALKNYFAANNVAFAKVYIRKDSISPPMLDFLHQFKTLKMKWISSTRKNAVDISIIQSALDILEQDPKIRRILFLSGDGDYYRLFKIFRAKNIKLAIVCRHGNFHKKILGSKHRIYSLTHLINHPENWWSHKKALDFKRELINSEKYEIKSPKVW